MFCECCQSYHGRTLPCDPEKAYKVLADSVLESAKATNDHLKAIDNLKNDLAIQNTKLPSNSYLDTIEERLFRVFFGD